MLLKVPSRSPAGEIIDNIKTLRHHQNFFRKISSLPMKRAETNASTKPNQLKGIDEPHPHDVLCGRGASISNFVGNLRWRELVKEKKEEYVKLHKLQRHVLSESIVYAVRQLDPPGRFLQRDTDTGLWFDIGDQKANEKTAQALREGAPKLRKKLASSKKAEEAKRELAKRIELSPPTLARQSAICRLPANELKSQFSLTAAATMPSTSRFEQQMASMVQGNRNLPNRPQQQPMPSILQRNRSFELEPLDFDFGSLFQTSTSTTLPTRSQPNLPNPTAASLPTSRGPSVGLNFLQQQQQQQQQQRQQQQQQQNSMMWKNMMMGNQMQRTNQNLRQQQHVQTNKSIDFLHPSRKIDMGFASRNPLALGQDFGLMEPTFDDTNLLSHAADLILNPRGNLKSSTEDEDEDEQGNTGYQYNSKGNSGSSGPHHHGDHHFSKRPSL